MVDIAKYSGYIERQKNMISIFFDEEMFKIVKIQFYFCPKTEKCNIIIISYIIQLKNI